jgi:hypothetical protein
MAVGDILNPKRVRQQGNERFDTVDADALSLVPREHIDAYARAVEAAPRNVGSSTPTGLIFQGFGLTLNPTSPSDGKVRVRSPVGVAFDSNGRMLLKEDGVQVDLTVPSGNSQVYAYFNEVSSDASVRRTISVATPFVESGQTMPTKLVGMVSYFVRAGDQTSIVASDVVNGATTPLCFLGVVANAGGVVTMTGYDSTHAPNGSFVTNRITTVVQPTNLPASNADGGSIGTMHGLANLALWLIGQVFWRGSHNFIPSASNNFGAFTLPAAGIDGLFDVQGEGVLTPVTRWRDWQQNIRALIDHHGYPGGQISTRDENWFVGVVPINLDPTTGYNGAGTPSLGNAAPLGVTFLTSGDGWIIPLSAAIPVGGIVKSLTVWYTSTSSANQITATVDSIALATGVLTTQVSRLAVTASPGSFSFDVMVTPSSGHGPVISSSTKKLDLVLQATTIISSKLITVYALQLTVVAPPQGWAYVGNTTDLLSVGDSVEFAEPVSGLNQRHAHLTTAATGSVTGQSVLTGANEVFVDADLAHSTEFIIKTGTVIDGGNALLMSVIIRLSNGDHWGLERRAGDANWQLKMSDDSNDQWINTGVAFASNTVYRVKYEFEGANRNSTSTPKVRMWINNALVATATALGTITPHEAGLVVQALAQTVSTGPYDVRVGRVRRVWNHLASGDNV